MLPYQIDLLQKVMVLLAILMTSAAASAYLLRYVRIPVLWVITFVVSLAFICRLGSLPPTENLLQILPAVATFGAAMGATLGSFTIAVTKGNPNGPLAVAITFGITAVAALLAAVLGLFSGYNFQGWGNFLFAALVILLLVLLIGLLRRSSAGKWGIASLGACLLFAVYLVYDFDKIIHLYHESTWQAAIDIASNLFLDILNIFIHLLPIILSLLDSK